MIKLYSRIHYSLSSYVHLSIIYLERNREDRKIVNDQFLANLNTEKFKNTLL